MQLRMLTPSNLLRCLNLLLRRLGEYVGDALTFQILTNDTQKILYQSTIRSALSEAQQKELLGWSGRNQRAEPSGAPSFPPNLNPPTAPEIVRIPSRDKSDGTKRHMSVIAPDDLITQTYLTDSDANTGERFRAKIVKKIISLEEGLEEYPKRVQFLVTYEGINRLYEIAAYNQVLDALEADTLDPNDQMWAFKDIVAHEGPLTSNNPSYRGSRFNVLVAWEDGSQTYEPLKTMAADTPAVCAVYAERANFLDTEGWKQLRRLSKRSQVLTRQLNQAKLASYRPAPLFKFGYQVQCYHKEAITLDEGNGNTKYRDAEKLEMSQHADYSTFKDLEKGSPGPEGYKRIQVHFVYNVKHDRRHKARLVAGEHLTDAVPAKRVYSGVVSLRSLRICIFLAELNGLQVHAANVGNAYLELEGHTLVVLHKALYCLRSSGLRWHERFANPLCNSFHG